MKLSFKLDFDQYEDEYPRIDNQRFYGFKQLSLKNNYLDTSMLREKVASDVFREAGLAASHTAWVELYVDSGDWPTYFGVYTLVEEVDDTVIQTQFFDDTGNLYKPDGNAATFAAWSFNEDQYVKKTNEDTGDYSDVEQLLEIINDDMRTTGPAQWKADLENIFDTDVFLKYLATNTLIQNRDTYGRMTHNYFLYNNPDTNKLTWIPRDNNESLEAWKRWWSLWFNFSSLTNGERPLIEYLYADKQYKAVYEEYLQEVSESVFTVDTMESLYERYAELIKPYALNEQDWYSFLNSENDFDLAISTLKQHVSERNNAAQLYLDK